METIPERARASAGYSRSRTELAEKLSLIDGLFIVQTHLMGFVGVMFLYEGDESHQRKADLISAVTGASRAKFTRVPFPRSTVSLSKSDWRIISRLERNLDTPLAEISDELPMSTRTLRRRMVRMVKGGVIFTLASVDVTAVREAVMAELVVEYESLGARLQVDRTLFELLDPYYFSTGMWESYSLFSMILPSVSKSKEILERVRRERGVSSARLELVDDRYEFYDCVSGRR